MRQDEEMVRGYLEARGFIAERFSKQEQCANKTPDFRVSRDGYFAFYCEVKSIIKDSYVDDMLACAPAGQIVGGERNDPTFNRLTADVHEAIKQFDAVNAEQESANVLSLINHHDGCGFYDLLAILTGNLYADDGTVHPIYRQFSHGRIRDERRKVHLYIWIDDFKPSQLLFSQTHEKHHASLCNLFGVNQNEILQIKPYQ